MAVVITVVNFLVILVLSTTKKLGNSQTIYKLSLAVANFLVGILVIPTCFYNLSQYLWQPLTVSSVTITGYKYDNINTTFKYDERNISKNIHKILQNDVLSSSYINCIGFLTIVSILVSIYTLVAAGFDRLFAIYKPLSYNKAKAIKYAKIACVICWIFVGVFSLIPIFTPPNSLRFGVSFLLIVAICNWIFVGILYIIILLLPLVLVWILNIMVYIIIKKHNRTFQQKFTENTQVKSDDVEKRLAATLRLMVGVFTFNTLPLCLILISSQFSPIIDLQRKVLDLDKVKNASTVRFIAILLLLGNSFCNFFIYNIRNKDFRNALKLMVKTFVKKTVSVIYGANLS